MMCHRCTWTPTDDDSLEAHAEASGHPLCGVCGWSLPNTEPTTCGACLQKARDNLTTIVTLYAELPQHLGHLAPIVLDPGAGSNDGKPLPGGTVLVLLSHGSEGLADDGDTAKDNDPQSVSFELAYWADMWREQRGETVSYFAHPAAVFDHAATYLAKRAMWAADTHPAFAQYSSDLHRIAQTLKRACGLIRTPTVLGVDCFDCGSHLIRPVNETTGLEAEDLIVCRGCAREYTDTDLAVMVRFMLTGDAA
jgi:hypothetical protein